MFLQIKKTSPTPKLRLISLIQECVEFNLELSVNIFIDYDGLFIVTAVPTEHLLTFKAMINLI